MIYIDEDFVSRIKEFTNSEQKQINKKLVQEIADLYDDPFSKYIEKNMYKKNKKIDLLQLITNVKNGKNADFFYQVFSELYIDFYISLLDKKFFSRSITGNSKFDTAFQRSIKDYFTSKKGKALVLENMHVFFDEKEDQILDLVEEKTETTKPKTKNYNWILAKGNKEKKLKYDIRDKVYHYIDVNSRLKKIINLSIMNMNPNTLNKILNTGIGLKTAIDMTGEIVIGYLINHLHDTRLTNPDIKTVADTMKEMIEGNNFIEKRYRNYAHLFLRE